jgi:phosphoenolpyruvate-protein kinase (PTS system EI component)
MPDDTLPALKVGAVGVGLFRSEFLFMGRTAACLTRKSSTRPTGALSKACRGCP